MHPKFLKPLLIAMYVAGIIGLNSPVTQHIFQFLTPLNLIVTAVFLIQTDPKISWKYVIISYLIGFIVEIIGVNTGLIFGSYSYGSTLGPKILGTPLLIGLNWFILSYCIGKALQFFQLPTAIFILLGASLMTAIDFIAEPVAIQLDMWSWTNVTPPLKNYIAWFITSSLLMFIFQKTCTKEQNPLAPLILVLQIVFFGTQFILYKL